MDSEYMKTS